MLMEEEDILNEHKAALYQSLVSSQAQYRKGHEE